MTKTLLGIAMCAAAPFAQAGEAATQQIARAGTQASAAGPAENFTGRVRVDPLFPADKNIQASGVGAHLKLTQAAR